MVVTVTTANMNKWGIQLQDNLNIDHGFCIERVFQLSAELFKSTKGQMRKAGAISKGDSPKSNEIESLRKARE
jgi:hypothetical protein